MDIIKMTQELGLAIQKSDEYVAHTVAKNAADADQKLQDMIGEFNMKKIAISQEVQKGDAKDADKVVALNTEVKEMYANIMQYPPMAAYNTTKAEMDKLLNYLQKIIVYAANGEDPYTVEQGEEGCSGSCSSCSGCH